MPDLHIAVNDLIGEGNRVVVYLTFSGVDKGGYRGRPPSGNSVRDSGIEIFRLGGDNIVERWGIVDTISMLHQINAIK